MQDTHQGSQIERRWSHFGYVRPDWAVRWEVVSHREVVTFRAVDRRNEDYGRSRSRVMSEVQASLDGSGPYVGVLAEHSEILASRVSVARPGTRGQITGWSPRSRQRLLRSVAEVEDSGHWAMLTLTAGTDWYRGPGGRPLTPGEFRRVFAALRKRLERRYPGWRLRGCWKLETQRRGAPHLHVGLDLPAPANEFRQVVRVMWHDLLLHDGSRCPGNCPDIHHVRYGAHLDDRYARKRKTAATSLARYFAKHGVWSTKEYQNVTPAHPIRQAIGLCRFFGMEPDPSWSRLADAWDTPGRWWGIRGCERPETLRADDVSPEVIRACRLLLRKVVARRSQRLIRRGCNKVPVRRSLASLHGASDRGWWLVSADGAELMRWALDTAQHVSEGPGTLAERIAAVHIPATIAPGRVEGNRASRGRQSLGSSVISGRCTGGVSGGGAAPRRLSRPVGVAPPPPVRQNSPV